MVGLSVLLLTVSLLAVLLLTESLLTELLLTESRLTESLLTELLLTVGGGAAHAQEGVFELISESSHSMLPNHGELTSISTSNS